MRMVPVRSSSIAAVGYEGASLFVEFRTGKAYRYDGVPAATFQAFLSAASKGTYYSAFVRGRYPSVRIR